MMEAGLSFLMCVGRWSLTEDGRREMIGIKMTLAGLASALALCGTAAAEPIAVGGDTEVLRASVKFADLNLASKAGREALEARVRGTARRLCGGAPLQPLHEMRASRKCRNEAIADAEPQIARAVANYGAIRFAGKSKIEAAVRK
jgi:UrcA family protein